MNRSATSRRSLALTVLAFGVLFVGAACGSDSTSTAEPSPTPGSGSVDDLLASAGQKLATMSTAQFQMVDELETGAKFFGTTFKSMEGEIRSPDSFRMLVDVVVPGLGFAEVEMLAVGEQAYMKFAADAPWLPLPLEQVPFNFGGVGEILRDLLPVITDAAITGREAVQGVQAIRVDGTIMSEGLSSLITGVGSGHAITLTLWIDEAEHTLRQIRIAGQVFDDDAAETTRLLIISGINGSVDIQLPDVASGP